MSQPSRSDGAGQARSRPTGASQPSFDRAPRAAERTRRAEFFSDPGPIDLRAPPNALAASLSTWRAGRNVDTGSSARGYDRWSEPVANDPGRRPLRRAGIGLAAIGRVVLSGAAAVAIVGAAVGIVYAWTALREPTQIAETPPERPVAAAAAPAIPAPAKPASVAAAPVSRSVTIEPQPSEATRPRPTASAAVKPTVSVPGTADARLAAAPDAEPATRIFETPPAAGAKPLGYAAAEEQPGALGLAVGEPADPKLPLPQARPAIEEAAPDKAEQTASVAPAASPAQPEPQQQAAKPETPRAAVTGGSRRTVSRSVNLRAAPANGSRVLGTIRAGSPVQVLSCKFWCEVVSDGRRGFIFRSFLSGEARGASAGVSNERTASTSRSQQRRAEKANADKPDEIFVPQNSR